MRFYKDYINPTCPADDWSCPYYKIKDGKCHMYQEEGCLPYLECEYWDGSDEAEELIFIDCMKESVRW